MSQLRQRLPRAAKMGQRLQRTDSADSDPAADLAHHDPILDDDVGQFSRSPAERVKRLQRRPDRGDPDPNRSQQVRRRVTHCL